KLDSTVLLIINSIQVAGLASEVRDLATLIKTSLNLPSVPDPVPVPAHTYPVSRPDTYNGDPELCEGFLLQCAVYFKNQPTGTDEAKIGFVVSCLASRALEWVPSSLRFFLYQEEGWGAPPLY
uniref:DUF4939 domain-containing protein n=1 Tax=Astyanax mexicanus TaxID=7994 RepID=A0A3B1KEP9_ASTMX